MSLSLVDIFAEESEGPKIQPRFWSLLEGNWVNSIIIIQVNITYSSNGVILIRITNNDGNLISGPNASIIQNIAMSDNHHISWFSTSIWPAIAC